MTTSSTRPTTSYISSRPSLRPSQRPSQRPSTRPSARPGPAGGQALPKPFIKWVGGKTQLLADLISRAPARFQNYHEPFMGGAALFFALHRAGRFYEREVHLSDVNRELVETYLGVRDQAERVIKLLRDHPYDKAHYYRVREQNPFGLGTSALAARFIYLNRAGFNGLYRVNKSGGFNVPFGRYKNPTICDADNLRAAARALRSANIHNGGFETVLTRAEPGDFVYFDPPYVPVSETSNFVGYAKGGFDLGMQEKLARVFEKLAAKGVYVMLSNSEAPWVKERFSEFHQFVVSARRNVNSKAEKRGPVGELIVTSYDPRELANEASARPGRSLHPMRSS